MQSDQAVIKDNGRVVTGEVALSYPYLFDPDQDDNGKDKWSGCFVLPEGADLKPYKKAAFAVVMSKFGEEKAKAMVKSGEYRLIGGPHHSIRTDVEGRYEGAVGFINATRRNGPPAVMTVFPDPDNENKPAKLTDRSRVYPGVIVRAALSPYWYDTGTSKGVAWGLEGVQIIKDGERLDGRVAAADEFEANMDAVASLDDLTDESGEGEPAAVPEAEGADLDLAELL